jgi:hypothetical protein
MPPRKFCPGRRSHGRHRDSPIIAPSVGREPGPAPNITRPRVRRSSRTIRCATQSGLW